MQGVVKQGERGNSVGHGRLLFTWLSLNRRPEGIFAGYSLAHACYGPDPTDFGGIELCFSVVVSTDF